MSLVYPSNGSNIACFVGIDPGTNNLGFAVIHFDLVTLKIKAVTATSFQSQRLMDKNDDVCFTHSFRMGKIIAQKNNLVDKFNQYRPITICCESPFYNCLRPSAFGPLVETMFGIKTAAVEYNPLVPFRTYSPSEVKEGVGAYAISKREDINKKDAVKQAVLSNPELTECFVEEDISSLDEHAIDAIAVAYTHFKKYCQE